MAMRRVVAIAVFVTLVLAACGDSGSSATPPPIAERDVTGVWALSAIEPEPAGWQPDQPLTLELRDDHRLLAKDECNTISAQWRLPSGRRDLAVSDIATTLMACPDHPDVLGFPWQSIHVESSTQLTVQGSGVVVTYTR